MAKTIKRNRVSFREEEHSFDRSAFSADDVIRTAKHFAEQKGVDFDTIRFEVDYERGYYDSVETTIYISGSREETDEEYNARREAIRVREGEARRATIIAAEAKERAEQREYERLKAKYGN